jgi:heterodisulfide reductase subunit C
MADGKIKIEKEFKYEIAARPGAGFFKRCFSCGTCTASCPVSEIDENFNPRLFIRKALLGQKEELLSSEALWYCTQCYTCFARCPQDVRFTDVMAVLRDMAVEEGYAPASLKTAIHQVDTLAQKIRHHIASHLWETANGKDGSATLKTITKELEKGLKELS